MCRNYHQPLDHQICSGRHFQIQNLDVNIEPLSPNLSSGCNDDDNYHQICV
ncbi:hypothetical protein Hanom_Chr08g00731621 [Helianthus anomalus]